MIKKIQVLFLIYKNCMTNNKLTNNAEIFRRFTNNDHTETSNKFSLLFN